MKRARRTIPLVATGLMLAAACATPGPVSLDELQPGQAVRTSRSTSAEGDVTVHQLVRQVGGSIEVRTAADSTPVRIHLVDLDRLQVVRGRSRPRGSMIGAFAGGLGGIVVGMACQARCTENESGRRYIAPLAGFAIGAPVGALVGIVLAPLRWVDVRIR
jgi:hypothetical protein